MPAVNYVAVVIAALAGFVLGVIWYSRFLFGRRPVRDAEAAAETAGARARAPIGMILVTFIFNLAGAYLLGVYMPNETIMWTVPVSAAIGLGFASASVGINHAFAARPARLLVIDGSFQVVRFALMGFILGAWH